MPKKIYAMATSSDPSSQQEPPSSRKQQQKRVVKQPTLLCGDKLSAYYNSSGDKGKHGAEFLAHGFHRRLTWEWVSGTDPRSTHPKQF